MTTISEQLEAKISKKDLRSVFWRSLAIEWSWNFERQQHMGFAFAMLPVLKKLYPKKEDRAAAAKRHLEFFNTTPYLATFILGIASSMEEKNASNPKFDSTSISNIKTALMGPIAGIGDSFFWGTLRVLATGIGTALALQGSILGPLLFLLVFNVPHYIIRYLCTIGGYKFGASLLQKIERSGLMSSLTYAASILGLMVIGGMTSSMVVLHVGGAIGKGDDAQKVQQIIDNIIPNGLSLMAVFIVYWLLKKGVSVTYILFGIFVVGILGAWGKVLV